MSTLLCTPCTPTVHPCTPRPALLWQRISATVHPVHPYLSKVFCKSRGKGTREQLHTARWRVLSVLGCTGCTASHGKGFGPVFGVHRGVHRGVHSPLRPRRP